MRFVIQRVTRGKVSVDASNPDVSNELYEYIISECKKHNI